MSEQDPEQLLLHPARLNKFLARCLASPNTFASTELRAMANASNLTPVLTEVGAEVRLCYEPVVANVKERLKAITNNLGIDTGWLWANDPNTRVFYFAIYKKAGSDTPIQLILSFAIMGLERRRQLIIDFIATDKRYQNNSLGSMLWGCAIAWAEVQNVDHQYRVPAGNEAFERWIENRGGDEMTLHSVLAGRFSMAKTIRKKYPELQKPWGEFDEAQKEQTKEESAFLFGVLQKCLDTDSKYWQELTLTSAQKNRIFKGYRDATEKDDDPFGAYDDEVRKLGAIRLSAITHAFVDAMELRHGRSFNYSTSFVAKLQAIELVPALEGWKNENDEKMANLLCLACQKTILHDDVPLDKLIAVAMYVIDLHYCGTGAAEGSEDTYPGYFHARHFQWQRRECRKLKVKHCICECIVNHNKGKALEIIDCLSYDKREFGDEVVASSVSWSNRALVIALFVLHLDARRQRQALGFTVELEDVEHGIAFWEDAMYTRMMRAMIVAAEQILRGYHARFAHRLRGGRTMTSVLTAEGAPTLDTEYGDEVPSVLTDAMINSKYVDETPPLHMQRVQEQAASWYGTQGTASGFVLKKKTKVQTRADDPWLDKDGHCKRQEFVPGGTKINVGTTDDAAIIVFPSPRHKTSFPLPFEVVDYETMISNDDANDADSTAVRDSWDRNEESVETVLGSEFHKLLYNSKGRWIDEEAPQDPLLNLELNKKIAQCIAFANYEEGLQLLGQRRGVDVNDEDAQLIRQHLKQYAETRKDWKSAIVFLKYTGVTDRWLKVLLETHPDLGEINVDTVFEATPSFIVEAFTFEEMQGFLQAKPRKFLPITSRCKKAIQDSAASAKNMIMCSIEPRLVTRDIYKIRRIGQRGWDNVTDVPIRYLFGGDILRVMQLTTVLFAQAVSCGAGAKSQSGNSNAPQPARSPNSFSLSWWDAADKRRLCAAVAQANVVTITCGDSLGNNIRRQVLASLDVTRNHLSTTQNIVREQLRIGEFKLLPLSGEDRIERTLSLMDCDQKYRVPMIVTLQGDDPTSEHCTAIFRGQIIDISLEYSFPLTPGNLAWTLGERVADIRRVWLFYPYRHNRLPQWRNGDFMNQIEWQRIPNANSNRSKKRKKKRERGKQ